MSGPRHLWSGDWEIESADHADGLARQRARSQAPAEPEGAAPAPPRRGARTGRRLGEHLRRVRAWSRRRLRVALLVALVALLVAATTYGVTSAFTATNSQSPAAARGTEAWLGVDLANAPVRGALVASVVPGSPAAAAGIRPGDLITQLDTEPIVTPAIFVSAISGLRPGDTVVIQVQRGASQYTVQVALAGRPAGTP
jgi:hypothetical protein